MERYKTLSKKPLPEINGTLHQLIHQPTGAKILYIETDDPENLFSILFRTVPEDSSGIAHILEHCVLCGSENYPVKDPFFAMTRRSLATFMNAMTGQDFTCYPAASENEKDFYNLFDVYLDSVFKPKLDPLSFKQEGWRLEPSDLEDPHSPLIYKGIVFNEMKGALSVPTARLVEEINKALYPTLTYGVNSGGSPEAIPTLTYEAFKKFWEEHYHPSRALFFFYGNLPLEKHLERLDEKILKEAKKLPPLPAIPFEKRVKEPKRVTAYYPAESKESPRFAALAWLTCNILEQREALALELIEEILLDTDASPLKRALLDSGAAASISSYVDGDVSEIPFVILFQGYQKAGERETLEALQKIVSEGLPKSLIENALHQLELDRCEITGGSYPYGLALFFRSALLSLHGGAPERGLLFHALFQEIREELKKNPRYLEDLIQKYLIDNPHRVFIEMEPSEKLAEEENQVECKKLKEIGEKLTSEEKLSLQREAKELESFQEELSESSLEILPKIDIRDIPLKGKEYLLEERGAKIATTFTSDFVYADLYAPVPQLQPEEIPYLRLFLMLLPQIGSGGQGFKETLEEMQAATGGITASLSIFGKGDSKEMEPMLHLSSKALSRNQEKMFSLLRRTAESANFKERGRLREILQKYITSLESNKVSHAMGYAISMSGASFSAEQRLQHLFSGWEQLLFMRKFASSFDSELDNLIDRLEQFKETLFFGERDLIITCEEKNLPLMRGYEPLLSSKKRESTFKFKELLPIPSQKIEIPAAVAFTATSLPGVLFTNRSAPLLSLAANIAEKTTLHPRIREQGGAYGARAMNDPLSNSFTLYSYRDPHIEETLQVFNEAKESLANGEFDEEDLEDAKRETIQSLDAPIPPGDRGKTAYSYLKEGLTFERREQFRKGILTATKEDVERAAKEHLLQEGISITFAGKELINGSC